MPLRRTLTSLLRARNSGNPGPSRAIEQRSLTSGTERRRHRAVSQPQARPPVSPRPFRPTASPSRTMSHPHSHTSTAPRLRRRLGRDACDARPDVCGFGGAEPRLSFGFRLAAPDLRSHKPSRELASRAAPPGPLSLHLPCRSLGNDHRVPSAPICWQDSADPVLDSWRLDTAVPVAVFQMTHAWERATKFQLTGARRS
jgi:hypothetical protein